MRSSVHVRLSCHGEEREVPEELLREAPATVSHDHYLYDHCRDCDLLHPPVEVLQL